MRKPISTTEKIRRQIAKGLTPKEIAKKLGVPVQYIYNVQYTERKKQGLGAIAAPVKAPTVGIGTPPKKKRGRPVGVKNKPKTGIKIPAFPAPNAIVTMLPSSDILDLPGQPKPNTAIMLPIEPTPLWKRVVNAVLRFFRGY